jgi:hypothetical protein
VRATVRTIELRREIQMIRVLSLATSLATLAFLLAPSALATRPDDRAGLRGPGALVATTDAVRPDDRGGVRGPGPEAIDPVPAVTTSGFDWTAAGIGLVGGLAIAVLAGGIAATTVQRHRLHRLA